MSRLTGTDALNLMEAYQAVYAPKELTEEQVWEEVELWVNSLVEEGYDLSDYTWDDLYEYYVQKLDKGEKLLPTVEGYVPYEGKPRRKVFRKETSLMHKIHPEYGGGGDEKTEKRLTKLQNVDKKMSTPRSKKETNEQVELYDIIFSHLLDEGYAATEDGALAIMSNMSEDWVHSIVEGYVDLFKTPPARGLSMKGDPSKGEKFGNPARLSPAMRALQRSDQLRASEPGSRRQIMQTRRSGQINRTFRSARLAGGASSSLGGIGTPSGTGRYTPGGRYGIGGVGLAD